MSLIIAATDFSEVGENAVNYACKLASAQNAEVVIIHSFIIPVMFSDIPLPGNLITDAQNDSEQQMTDLLKEVADSFPGLSVRGKVIYGDTVSVVNDFIEGEKKPWLIVVGNNRSGEYNWLDSTLIDVFKKMEYPVLAVPDKTPYKQVSSICFAFDNKHTGNETAIAQLTDIASRLNAKLHVLTIQHENENGIDESVKQMLTPANPSYHFVTGAADVDAAIRDFNANNGIDWLVLIPRRHSFFEGLFHKSHTKAIAHSSDVPVIALHEIA